MVERDELVIHKSMGMLEVYTVTSECWEIIPRNFRSYLKSQLKKKYEEAKERKRTSHIEDYVTERQSPFYHTIANHRFCKSCFNTTKNVICDKCGNDTSYLDVRARVPKKNASKTHWHRFLNRFYPKALYDSNWWKNRKALL